MYRFILSKLLILITINIYSQKEELIEGFVVLESNDTITGILKNKSYYTARSVQLTKGDQDLTYNKKSINKIGIESKVYVKCSNDFLLESFYVKTGYENLNIYSKYNRKYLGVYDSDINYGNIKNGCKFYCNDFLDNQNSLVINNDSIDSFIKDYNSWKTQNPDSKSFYEKNLHSRKLVNFKLSFLIPGTGVELKLLNNISMNSFLKVGIGYNVDGFIIDPSTINQLRYYYDTQKRIQENKRTYKFTGNYFCLDYGYVFKNNDGFLGFEYGLQRTRGKYWYYNFGIGVGKYLNINDYLFLFNYDIGFIF